MQQQTLWKKFDRVANKIDDLMCMVDSTQSLSTLVSWVANHATVQYPPILGSIFVYYKLSWHRAYMAPLCPNVIDCIGELYCCHKLSAYSGNEMSQNSLAFALNPVRSTKHVLLFNHRNFLPFEIDFPKPRNISSEIAQWKNSPSTSKKSILERFQILWNS